jgi:hypothetical protein
MVKGVRKRTKDFFVSYTSADRKWAEWIASVLESDKHTTVIQSWDFGPGCNFVLEMHKALQACRRLVLVYSPAYFKSLYTQAEWVAALAEDVSSDQRILLPVRVKRCAPGGLLRPIGYVDLVDVAESDARKQLLFAARPPKMTRRAAVTFPGKRQPAERTAFDVARDLRDVLNTTLVTFSAQCEARDKLYYSMRKRLRVREQLEFEDFFHQYFARMNAIELRQHAIIRGYTKDVLRDYNARALKLCRELMDAQGEGVDLEEEVPSLWTLHEHLTVWLQKFKTAIRIPSTCLVYVGPAEGIDFPSDVDQELDDLVESHRAGGRRIVRARRRRLLEG